MKEWLSCDTRMMCRSKTSQQIAKLLPKCSEGISFLAIFQEMCTWTQSEVEKKVTMVTVQFLDLHYFNNKHVRSQK